MTGWKPRLKSNNQSQQAAQVSGSAADYRSSHACLRKARFECISNIFFNKRVDFLFKRFVILGTVDAPEPSAAVRP